MSKLEEAAKEYRHHANLNPERYKTFGSNIINAFIAGANWQKEQMMKDAITIPFSTSLPNEIYNPLWINGAEIGDKIKLIIIKEAGK